MDKLDYRVLEKKAIEKLGLKREEIPVAEFRDTCKSFNEDYIHTFGDFC